MKPMPRFGICLICIAVALSIPYILNVRKYQEDKKTDNEYNPATIKSEPNKETLNSDKKQDQFILMKVTAYCICSVCCEGFSDGKTSIMDDAAVFDGVAADPKVLKYRTKLDIPGVGIKEVDDTGGAMRQSGRQGITHIDVRMESHSKARQWGVQWLKVKKM